MKRIYYIISDTTRKPSDPLQMTFSITYPMNDIAGMLRHVSEHNKTPIDKLRLYICPDKKTYDRILNDHLARIKQAE